VLQKLRQSVLCRRLLAPGERVAVAVSGGADSVALLRALLELREELGVVLSVAHFHHGIRAADADADQQFVAQLAKRFDLEFHLASGNAPEVAKQRKVSLETAARDLRHEFFARLVAENQAEKIATAHTLDDQAETVLMRIIRGTGPRGLAGIAPSHQEKRLVRPLLGISRQEIEVYLTSRGQTWREDLTNQDLSHTRNKVRHQLLPLLEGFNPEIRRTLSELAEISRGEAEYWKQQRETLVERLVQRGKPSRSGRSSSGKAGEMRSVDLAGLLALPLALQRELLHALGEQIGLPLEFRHVDALIALARQGKKGKVVQLPGNWKASSSFRELQLQPPGSADSPDYEYCLPLPGEVQIPAAASVIRSRVVNIGMRVAPEYNSTLLLDRSLLRQELIVRNWRPGDRFFPAHTHSPRKVKELLQPDRIGREISAAERRSWPVVESAGEIVWMRGFPVAAKYVYREGDAVLIDEVRTKE
jgi:tRNA(Ile)-lysidine synthase